MSAAGRCKASPGVAFQGIAVRQESGQFYLLLTDSRHLGTDHPTWQENDTKPQTQ